MKGAETGPGDAAAGAESPVPSLVARLFAQSTTAVRGRVVACLLAALGPLALAALAEGRFARLLLGSSTDVLAVSMEEAQRLTEGQVLALARYAWEASPEVFTRLAQVLQAEDPMLLRTLTGALFVIALGARSRRRR
jgi:hypothetical protein